MDNFVGNIEARYILNGNVDVVVCDGLLGNIALKALEGTAKTMKTVITDTFKSSFINKIKGLIIKSTLTKTLKKYDYKENGGAVLLGVNKPVIKVHGSSSISTFEKSIIQAENMLKNKIVEKIENAINI
ncbi:Phosphate acyltransferase [compost metagenome]